MQRNLLFGVCSHHLFSVSRPYFFSGLFSFESLLFTSLVFTSRSRVRTWCACTSKSPSSNSRNSSPTTSTTPSLLPYKGLRATASAGNSLAWYGKSFNLHCLNLDGALWPWVSVQYALLSHPSLIGASSGIGVLVYPFVCVTTIAVQSLFVVSNLHPIFSPTLMYYATQVRREHLVALSKSPSLWTDTMKGQAGAHHKKGERGDSNRQLSLEEIFELLDLDGDGELTKEEVLDRRGCCCCIRSEAGAVSF